MAVGEDLLPHINFVNKGENAESTSTMVGTPIAESISSTVVDTTSPKEKYGKIPEIVQREHVKSAKCSENLSQKFVRHVEKNLFCDDVENSENYKKQLTFIADSDTAWTVGWSLSLAETKAALRTEVGLTKIHKQFYAARVHRPILPRKRVL